MPQKREPSKKGNRGNRFFLDFNRLRFVDLNINCVHIRDRLKKNRTNEEQPQALQLVEILIGEVDRKTQHYDALYWREIDENDVHIEKSWAML